MNDNTILRIKVPAHLYESVKEQLTINEAKKSGKAFGDWKVVKEKKLPKDGMKKVEEKVEDKVEEVNNIEEKDNKTEMKAHTIDELKEAKAKLEKKIEEMESGKKEESLNEAVDPNLIAGIIGLLFGSLPILYTLIKQYVSAKTPEDKKKVIAQAADAISKKMGGNMEEGVNELFGLGKSKNQFKPGQKVMYTASNGTTEYNGEYIVGKVYDNGEVGLYSPDSPMKKITINAKPENLKSA